MRRFKILIIYITFSLSVAYQIPIFGFQNVNSDESGACDRIDMKLPTLLCLQYRGCQIKQYLMTVDLFFDVEQYLEDALRFLSKHQWIFNSSNTEYIKNKILSELPPEWTETLENCGENELKLIPSGFLNDNWPVSFKEFLHQIAKLKPQFETISFNYKATILNKVNPKKQYEINQLSVEIHNICQNEVDILIDLGAGLGYLSQMLHEKFNYKILCLEGDSKRCDAAVIRQDKYYPSSKDHVKYISHFIEEASANFIMEQLVEQFGKQAVSAKLGIIGLHACGDLTVTAIKLYYKLKNAQKLVIMPCCYHKLTHSNETLGTFHNIPASSKFQSVFVDNRIDLKLINRPFLRLACQETAVRWQNKTHMERIQQGFSMHERALVETLRNPDEIIVKCKTPTDHNDKLSFQQLTGKYLLKRKSDKQEIEWTRNHENKYNETVKQHPNGCKLSLYLLCFQNAIQAICENVVQLDRIFIIQEMCDASQTRKVKTKLKKMENDALTPRCFILILEEELN